MMTSGAKILTLLLTSFAFTSFSHGHVDCKKPEMRQGTESSGGGLVVVNQFAVTLLDLLRVNPELRESRTSSASFIIEPQQIIFSPTPPFSPTPQDPALQRAFTILNHWKAVHYDVVTSPTLSSGLFYPTVWSFVDESLCPAPAEPPQNAREVLQMAAYYEKGSYLIRIHRPLWNRMGLRSQAGLILHENLRSMQMGLERNFDEEMLQQATALLVMCEPSLLLGRYIDFLLSNQQSQAEKAYGSFKDILQQCSPSSLSF